MISKPSPMERVAELKRSREKCSSIPPILHKVRQIRTALIRQPLRAATFPRGEGFFQYTTPKKECKESVNLPVFFLPKFLRVL